MADFHAFAIKVHQRYNELAKGELFVAGTGADDIFAHYLASFPKGSNPIYLTNTQHDCSCCKQFVRNLGRVLAIVDGELDSPWNVKGLESPYKEVADSMHGFVCELGITSVFRTKEKSYGAEVSRQLLEDGSVKRWNHFHGKVLTGHLSDSPGEAKGMIETTAQVFRRGLVELSSDAVQQVLDLIDANALYRGQEHRSVVVGFQKIQNQYKLLKTNVKRSIFVWSKANDPATRFRNTVIGTLVQDLSEGVDLEKAVKSFETKVAPTNYKRTSALITPRMVEDAMSTIKELGLEPALYRRLAKMSDISVNNVLWADRADQPLMKGGLLDTLMKATKTDVAVDKAADVSIDEFMSAVLPQAQGIEMRVSNAHLSNFMTLTAPQHPDTGKLFRWSNDFAWSYDGNITDSIKERVKTAGGNVNAKLRFSLAWYNKDDLDLHVIEPNGNHIYFANKVNRRGKGHLDVDMNAGWGDSRTPVENVAFAQPDDGTYHVFVQQYQKRETIDVGFTMELASGAGTVQLSYRKPANGDIVVGTFQVKNGAIVESKYGSKDIVGTGIPQNKWGIKTENMVRVRTVMHSPNYWDDNAVGNKHWFFILDGCHVDEPMRGIYNEFLAQGLEKHRKVFEVLGDKTRCVPAEEQLSGLGFSSTRNDTVTVSVKSARGTRLYNVRF